MITKMKKPRKRPYWASQHVWEKTTSLVLVPLLGYHYEIPVTETTAPILSLLDGSLDPWSGFKKRRSDFERRNAAEDGFRDIISALYHQIEAIAIASEAQLLAQDIQNKLEPLIQRKLHERVEEKTNLIRLQSDAAPKEKKD